MALERTLVHRHASDGVARNLIGDVYHRFEKCGLGSSRRACCS